MKTWGILLCVLLFGGNLPLSRGRCRTGLEDLQKFVYEAEVQAKAVVNAARRNCKSCEGCLEGCFRNTIYNLKYDIDDLAKRERTLMDSVVNSQCSVTAPIMIAGPSGGSPAQIFEPSASSTIPSVNNVFGIDYDGLSDSLVFNKFFTTFKTDLSGTSPQEIETGALPIVSPVVESERMYYYGILQGGGIKRVKDGLLQEIITTAENNDNGVFSIAVDPKRNRIFWTTSLGSFRTLYTSSSSGKNIKPFVTDPRQFLSVAVDAASKFLYYTTFSPPYLVRMNLDTHVREDFIPLTNRPGDLAVCLSNIYVGYAGMNGYFEEYDGFGNLVKNVTGYGSVDFLGVATSTRPIP